MDNLMLCGDLVESRTTLKDKENFRTGFQLGTMLTMETVSENEMVLFEV